MLCGTENFTHVGSHKKNKFRIALCTMFYVSGRYHKLSLKLNTYTESSVLWVTGAFVALGGKGRRDLGQKLLLLMLTPICAIGMKLKLIIFSGMTTGRA